MNQMVRNLVLGVVAVIAIGLAAYGIPRSAETTKEKAHAEENHGDEGVEMPDAKVAAAGIELQTAKPGILQDNLVLNGILQPNQEAVVQVTPRFPGVVREIRKRVGDVAEKGELLAKIESNQSLTVYEVRAPIGGTVIDRQISLGEYASEQKLAFTVADLSTVWVDFSVYRRDLHRVKAGDTVQIDVGDGGPAIDAKLSYLSPIGSTDTQSALARATVSNEGMRLRPGLFVTGRLILSAKPVAIAVKSSALQTWENRNVIFVRNGSKFEARDVELGARDAEQVEVTFGLLEGDIYAARNSFIIKAELAKGTASHDH